MDPPVDPVALPTIAVTIVTMAGAATTKIARTKAATPTRLRGATAGGTSTDAVPEIAVMRRAYPEAAAAVEAELVVRERVEGAGGGVPVISATGPGWMRA